MLKGPIIPLIIPGVHGEKVESARRELPFRIPADPVSLVIGAGRATWCCTCSHWATMGRFIGSRLARFCWALTLGGCLSALGAQASRLPEGRIPFQSYGAPQGLGNLSIWCLEQDSAGFLWIGTEDGLFRYDGSRFQGFGRELGLQNTWVRTLCIGSSEQLWIGTTHGLALREKGQIRQLAEPEGLPQAEVFALAVDGESRLWVATERGLFRQRMDSLTFEGVPGWPDRALARSLWINQQTVYVTSQTRLLRYDLKNATLPVVVKGPWRERLDAVVEDGQGRLWVRSRSGLWMRQNPGAAFQDLSQRVGPAAYDGALKMTARGTLLIPSVDGLMRVRGQEWEMLGEAQGVPTAYVNRAMEDREGCLWVGGLGLHRTLSREAWRQHTVRDGILGGVVRSILKDGQGRMWVGTTNGVSMAQNGSWKSVPETLRQAFLGMALASDGALWMGGAPARLRRWVPGSSRWMEFPKPESTITNMIFDPEGVLWVATRRQGLFRVDPQGASYRVEPIQPPGIGAEARVQSMAAGKDGRVWMATTHGLLLREKGQWRWMGKAQGLKSANLFAVHERPSGNIWVSYEDVQGLSRFRPEGDHLVLLEHFDQARGFFPRKAYFMQEDALGRLWVGTSQGVVFFDGNRFQSFGVADGLPGDDCNGSAFLAEPDGGVWIGTLGGMARFYPERLEGSPKPPVSFVLSAEYGPSKLASPFPTHLQIPKREANIEFRFTGLTYLHETRVLHQVRLVGLEDAWRNTDIRQARYTNLGPGTYRFEVRAGFGDGAWGPVASLSFEVLPAWYQTWWCRTLAGVGILGLIAVVVRVRMNALKNRNRELEGLVEARTHDLGEANEILRQLTVTDQLTGLKNRRFIDLTIQDDLAQVHRDYQTIHRGQIDRMPINVDMLFLMVDLDHFKLVNDTYGHAAGDLLLQQVKDRLLEAVRDSDTVVRWGGEEFLVVARHTDRSQGTFIASRILDFIGTRPFDLGNGVMIQKTCSLGYCPYPMAPDHPDALAWQKIVEVADRCLYAAKLSGRNGWVGIQGQCVEAQTVIEFLDSPETHRPDHCEVVTSFPDASKLTWH